MKFILILPAVLLIISSCSSDGEDCVCSQEFRFIDVVVVDRQNLPITGLLTEVKNESGKIYDLSDQQFLSPGYYVVMSDNYTADFSVVPKKILFTRAVRQS